MKILATSLIILFYCCLAISQTTITFSEPNISDCFSDTNNSEAFTPLTITGQTFQDNNAMNDGIANGFPRGLENVYAVLVDSDTGLVIDTDLTEEGFSTDENSTVGTYSLNGVSNQNYHVILQYYPISPPAFGDMAPTVSNIGEVPEPNGNVWSHNADEIEGAPSPNHQDGISLYFNTNDGQNVTGVDFGYFRGAPTNED